MASYVAYKEGQRQLLSKEDVKGSGGVHVP